MENVTCLVKFLCWEPIPFAKWNHQWLLGAPNDHVLDLYVCTLWQIVLARNKLVWEGIHVHTTSVLYEALLQWQLLHGLQF